MKLRQGLGAPTVKTSINRADTEETQSTDHESVEFEAPKSEFRVAK